jgi:hypothetical protein
MENRLTLWEIEQGWLDLIEARESAQSIELPEERAAAMAACEQALSDYIAREVQKVDGIRAIVRNLEAVVTMAKEERDYQNRRAKHAEDLIARIKDTAKGALEAVGKKKVEGRTGVLMVKGNGGLQSLDITDPSLLPDECCRMEGWISAAWWPRILQRAMMPADAYEMRRVPSGPAIREELAKPCAHCNGTGRLTTDAEVAEYATASGPEFICRACGGSGKSAVPGARLLPRGTHLEIR